MQTRPLVRQSLVDQACDRLREEIVRHDLPAGSRVTETELAERLGISRTPLRAAIARLCGEGLVHVQPGRGIRIAPADAQVVREVYPILGALDRLAVRTAVEQGALDLSGLRQLNRDLGKRLPRERLFELDREFHRRLREGCANGRLLELIDSNLRLAARFDGAGERGMHALESSRAEHESILAAVERMDAAEAGSLVEAHWVGGIAVVVEWLAANRETKGADDGTP
jgi:DNA-binding GntR family transcriptional regulator